MKKSDFIQKAAQTIKPILNNHGLNVTSDGAEFIMDITLKEFQRLGMKPPAYVFQDGDLGSDFRNEWEEEKND